jgi:hypothetical protein
MLDYSFLFFLVRILMDLVCIYLARDHFQVILFIKKPDAKSGF